MRAPAIVLVLLGATAQLAGLLLVALEIRASRALVRVHRAEADTIAKANASIYAGLGAASVFSQWAMREHLALRLLLADALRSESRRAAYGALLLGVGIALSAAGSMVGLA